jgi:hypothetical protein
MHPRISRHYGLDWLRIAAFALLILFHIAVYFAPGRWIIKIADPAEWLVWPMLALRPWRLPLLFLVAGFASRALLARTGSPADFFRSRSWRLLLPLLFAVTFLTAPQTWVRLVVNHGYGEGFLHFWAIDWFSFGTLNGVELPNTEHLWFLFHLWEYTLIVAAAALWLPRRAREKASGLLEWLSHGSRLLWAPAVAVVGARLSVLFVIPEAHGLFNDWVGHISYLPAFLFGFGLAGTSALWPPIRRLWKPAALVAALAYAAMAAVHLAYGGGMPPHLPQALAKGSMVAMGWASILLLLGAADRWLNRDHPVRAQLGEAIFPCYIIHQTIIVMAAFALRGRGLPAAAEFAIVLTATIGGCWLFYEAGRRIRWLRPFVGLSPEPAPGEPRLSRSAA